MENVNRPLSISSSWSPYTINAAGWQVILQYDGEERVYMWWLSTPEGGCAGSGYARTEGRAIIDACKLWTDWTATITNPD